MRLDTPESKMGDGDSDMRNALYESGLFHGDTVEDMSEERVREVYMARIAPSEVIEFTCCDPFERGCTNTKGVEEIGIDSVCSDCHEIAARALGNRVDKVPAGGTGVITRLETRLRRNELTSGRFRAILDEHGRLARQRAKRGGYALVSLIK